MTTTTAPPTISVELPEPFDPRWARLPGITIDGRQITIDPAAYFFRFSSRLLAGLRLGHRPRPAP